eukprot:scaffold88715_cov48-Cyclotella_meneghiniana.AAC.1
MSRFDQEIDNRKPAEDSEMSMEVFEGFCNSLMTRNRAISVVNHDTLFSHAQILEFSEKLEIQESVALRSLLLSWKVQGATRLVLLRSPNTWICDSGASCHSTNNLQGTSNVCKGGMSLVGHAGTAVNATHTHGCLSTVGPLSKVQMMGYPLAHFERALEVNVVSTDAGTTMNINKALALLSYGTGNLANNWSVGGRTCHMEHISKFVGYDEYMKDKGKIE